MSSHTLEVTYRKGRQWAAYVHVSESERRAAASREVSPHLIADFDGKGALVGALVGLEILAFDSGTVSRINPVLESCGVTPLAPEELLPLRAA